MEFILTGIVGFILLLLFDLFSMLGKKTLKYLFGILGVAIITVSTFFILYNNMEFEFDMIVIISNFFFLILFCGLEFYSVIYEVGIKATYSKNNEPSLITNGTYALVRHPGVLWFLIIFINLYFIFGGILILYTGIIWSVTNIVYVTVQEKYIFIKIFKDYREYQKATPLIIPSIKSIKTTLKYENWRKK